MSAFHDSEVCCRILESLPVGVCVVDTQKKIVFWSDGAERITGHMRHQVIGHSCVAEGSLHCNEPDCDFCSLGSPLERAIKTSHPAEAVGYVHHKSGHEVLVHIRAVPVFNPHGSMIGAVETFEEQQPAVNPDHREESLELPGCIDEATGVASHTIMRAHLRETLGTFVEMGVPFGVLCVRLQGLDQFRAKFGPEAAASLLRVVARTLEGALWKTDFVGRWSDDVFLVILNSCRENALHSVRERIRHMLAGDAIEWWGEKRSLPLWIGQATAQAGDTVEALVERAQNSLSAGSLGRPQTASAASGSQVPRS
jgi:diguanylate cyclase (GGDEF)-like protein/PAS domain S-box-containing protein